LLMVKVTKVVFFGQLRAIRNKKSPASEGRANL